MINLNLTYGSFLDIKVNPIKIDIKDDSIASIEANQDVFKLGELNVEPVEITFGLAAEDDIVIRQYLPENIIPKLNDLNFGYFYLGVIKNNLMLKLAELVDLNKYEIKFGPFGNYFKTIPDRAGLEMRIYAILKTEEK